jgi:DNA-binding NarL/FixJ family response regulator
MSDLTQRRDAEHTLVVIATAAGAEDGALRMLIVDDDPDMRMLMRVTLDLDPGLAIAAEATDGDDGVAAWRTHQPDVVVLDMRMPRMTGLQAAQEILAAKPGQAIVMCSAYMDEGDREHAVALGVRACLDKYDLAELPTVVRRAASA